MAPADSNRLAVLKNIQTSLQAIVGVTFHYPLTNPTLQVTLDQNVTLVTGYGVSDLPAYVVEPTPQGKKKYLPSRQMIEEFIINVSGRYDADSADPATKSTIWENLLADIETALLVDDTRGGHACDTRLLEPQIFTGVGSTVVIVVQPVKVTIYRPFGNGIGS